MHNDTRVYSYMEIDSVSRVELIGGRRKFYNKGVYDKDKRIRNFYGW